jgi:starch synthase
VGGLNDTVKHFETGFVFEDATVKALSDCLLAALKLYQGRTVWRRIQQAGMSQDLSWTSSAKRYFNLYKSLKASARL